MLIRRKYLVVPYNNRMVLKQLEFYENGMLLCDFSVKLDFLTPECLAYVDMEAYLGKELDVICRMPGSVLSLTDESQEGGDSAFVLEQVDAVPEPDAQARRYRPHIHVTAPYGWLSDPNGLVYADGVYHMFYQHNPAGTEGQNMHWGHAVSRDLLHWRHLQDALHPDEKGTIFSGSAIADIKNVLRLQQKETPLLLFYTAAGGQSRISASEPFTIGLAYSLDGGRTFQKYPGNPLLPNIVNNNRDPKVTYCAPLKAYVMALYLEDSRYCLLSSENLLEWRMFQSFTLPGDSECPDLYSLCLEQNPQKQYWIFSGASDYYYVGEFQNGQFVSSQPVKRLHYGSCSYAAQVFSNMPDGRRVRLSWQRVEFPSAPFNGQISIPSEVRLCVLENECYLCLRPVKELEAITRQKENYSMVSLSPDTEDGQFRCFVPRGALDVFLQTDYQAGCVLRMDLFGVTVICDMTKNQLLCGGSVSPITIKQKQLRLRMILDKNSIELFLDEGEFYISDRITCDYHLNSLRLQSSGPMVVRNIRTALLQLEDL